MASEAGISFQDFQEIGWREFEYIISGYLRRLERGWDYTRNLIAAAFNSSGFAKHPTSAKQLMELSFDEVIYERLTKKEIDELKKSWPLSATL